MITGKTILVTGAGNIGGQMSEYLCQNNRVIVLGYGADRLDGYYAIKGIAGDIGEKRVVDEVFGQYLPDIVIHTAALTNIPKSYEAPEDYVRANCIGTHNVLASVRAHTPDARVVYFSTAEIFGRNYSTYAGNKLIDKSDPQDVDNFCFQYEGTALGAYNVYGATKLYCQNIVDMEVANGMKAVSLICFNVEGPNRMGDFLTKKVVKYIGELYRGETDQKLKLGDLSAKRDWLYVTDCIGAILPACCTTEYGRYCLASGELHSVEEFVEKAFLSIGRDYRDYVQIDRALVRKVDRPNVRGKNDKIKNIGWAQQVSFDQMVSELVKAELDV